MDLGPPISYLALEKRMPVYSADGEHVGHITHIIAAVDQGLFEGIVIGEHLGPGGQRFVDADEIEDMYTGGVVLKLDREQAAQLPEPSPNPPVIHEDPLENRRLSDRLKRAWHDLSGHD